MKRRRRRNPDRRSLANAIAGPAAVTTALGGIQLVRNMSNPDQTRENEIGALALAGTAATALVARHFGKGDPHPFRHAAYGTSAVLGGLSAFLFAKYADKTYAPWLGVASALLAAGAYGDSRKR